MNKVFVSIVLMCVMVVVSNADNTINWGTTISFQMFDSNGTSVLNPSGPYTDGSSDLVQLIWAGSGGADNGVDLSSATGVSVDDQVVAYSWVGAGEAPANRPGRFVGPTANNVQPNGAKYYIRVWDAPAGSIGTGNIPTAPTYYGDTSLFTIQNNGVTPSADSFLFTSNISTTTPVPVPEPATAVLFGLGVLATAAGRRMRIGKTK